MSAEMINQKTEKGLWLDLLLLALAVLVLFGSLGARALWAAEGRWAEVTREMLLNGEYFHPTIGGQPYFDKPLLTYWLIAFPAKLTGVLNEWMLRLPNVLSGLLVLWATLFTGRKLWNAQVGRLAAWLLLTTYGFTFWARTGMADMENLAAIMLCVAWYWHRRDKPDFVTFVVFYLVAFLGALTKGLAAIAIPILAVCPDVLREKRWKYLLKPSHFMALAVAGAVYAIPFVIASRTNTDYQSSGIGMVIRENVIRYLKPFDHKEPFYVYFFYLPMLMLPWAPLLLTTVFGSIGARRQFDRAARWLLMAIGIIFLFFTLSGSRRSYYILPIVPLCALWMAVFIHEIREGNAPRWTQWGVRVQAGLLALVGVIGLLAPVTWLVVRERLPWLPGMLFASIFITVAGALLAGFIVYRTRSRWGSMATAFPLLPSLLVAMAILLAGYYGWQQRILEASRTARPFAREVVRLSGASDVREIGVFLPGRAPTSRDQLGETPLKGYSSVLFYLNVQGPITLLYTPEKLQAFAAQDNPRLLLTQQRNMELLAEQWGGSMPEPAAFEPLEPYKEERKRKKKMVAWILSPDMDTDAAAQGE